MLGWSSSINASGYEVCVDTVDNDACDGSWSYVGDVTTAPVTGLAESTPTSGRCARSTATAPPRPTAARGGGSSRPPELLDDGFESGDTSGWSLSIP